MSAARHTAETRRIQARLERWELRHLRQLAAEQDERLQALAERVDRLERDLAYAESCAESWQRDWFSLQEHLDRGTEDARTIGLTKDGALLVVRTGAQVAS